MARQFIDLSLTLEAGASERVPLSIRYVDHHSGAQQMSEIFGVPAAELPGGVGWAGEELTLITHAGTHMDAPWHYGPLSGGSAARSIDSVPLEWCYGPGVVLDFRDKADGEEITVEDLLQALAKIHHRLHAGEIVLLMTGADAYWGQPDYPERGSGLGRCATLWLAEQGIKVIGIDAWGFDRPFGAMRLEYERTRDAKAIWAAHFAGREREYCQLEKLTNLHLLPPTGFTVICFPIKVAHGSAGWTRVVAVCDTQSHELSLTIY
ncbi:MAG: cyclase family protein [Acidobacteria bacterium]|nr:cyclase family protein [Acidobacteriota bacterium]